MQVALGNNEYVEIDLSKWVAGDADNRTKQIGVNNMVGLNDKEKQEWYEQMAKYTIMGIISEQVTTQAVLNVLIVHSDAIVKLDKQAMEQIFNSVFTKVRSIDKQK